MLKYSMRKKVLSMGIAIGMVCSVLGGSKPMKVQAASAAVYEPLTISSGFNADVVATSSTKTNAEGINNTDSLDSSGKAGSRACFYSSGFSSSTGYLPSNRIITDSSNSSLKWELGSYTGKNALKLAAKQSGTVTFSKTGCYQDIYLLSVCGGVEGGSTSMKAVVNYTDGTSGQGTFTVVDWYTSTSNATAIYKRVNSGKIDGSTSGGPYMTKSTISGLNTSKVVKSITITNTGTSSSIFLSLLAATGKTADVGKPAPRVEESDIGSTEFLITWDKTTNAASYRVDVSLNSSFTTMVSGYNNKVVTDNQCLVSGLKRDTTYYYRVRAANSSGAQSASSDYKSVTTYRSELLFNDNGGSGGPGRKNLNASWQLPEHVSVPTRKGYVFSGYYTALIGGTKYYDEAGNRTYDTAFPETCSTKMNIYAQWIINSSTLTVDANGGVVEGGATATYTKKYNESVKIKDPVHSGEEGINFLGWSFLDSEGNASTNGKVVKGAGYTTFIFGSETDSVMLKAIWSDPYGTRIEVSDSVTQNVTGENLERIFQHTVQDSDYDKGLTAGDLVAEKREIEYTVEKMDVNIEEEIPTEVAPIEDLLGDSSNKSVVYYDISVDKIINDVRTPLKELPETVTFSISLTDELADRTGYSVYRIHEGVAERMSSARTSPEYYEVKDDCVLIHTKKFSTYAITASNSVIGEYPEEELDGTNNFAGTDVQGRYVDSTSTRVYKLDVEWGTMKFVFNKRQKWNPDNHEYNDGIEIMLDEDAYNPENNEIVISNHSNADVRVGMQVVEKNMDGVEIFLKQENSDEATDAVNMYLNRVADASGNALAEQLSAFVRLDAGMLNVDGLSGLISDGRSDVFQQIARVVVTMEAVDYSETTPLYY